MKILRYLSSLVVVAASLATVSHAQTTTLEFNSIGSSALFLELGEAAVVEAGNTGFTVCSWSTKDSEPTGGSIANQIYANDAGALISGTSIKNTGNFWVVWTASTGTCTAPTGTVDIWSDLQTDSAVGNRCVFRTGAGKLCTLIAPANTSPNVTSAVGANLIPGQTDIAAALPTTIINAITTQQFGVAATDVRPEDSQFQLYRALQPTTTEITATGAGGAQYRGLGLASSSSTCVTIAIEGGSLDGAGGAAGSVPAAVFALPGGTDPCTSTAAVTSFTTTAVGVTPVIIGVNNSSSSVFDNSSFTNIPSIVLSSFLDGELCRAEDILQQAHVTDNDYVTTLIREPFSGTYTTVEYNLPATRTIQGSQESAVSAPQTQPTAWTTCNAKGGTRTRVTSTGNAVYAIQHNASTLGYFFWSTANGANFTTSNGKYLTVDGVDPFFASYDAGCIPVSGGASGCELSEVNFDHIKDGTYPLWSIQRLVTTSATPAAQVAEVPDMVSAAQGAVGPTRPDFVLPSAFHLVRTHFLTPVPSTLGTAETVSNGDCTGATEKGGDVGGVILSNQADQDYCTDYGVTTGIINLVNNATTNGNPGIRR